MNWPTERDEESEKKRKRMMQWEINPQMVGVAAGGDSEDPRRVTQARWHIIAMSFEDNRARCP